MVVLMLVMLFNEAKRKNKELFGILFRIEDGEVQEVKNEQDLRNKLFYKGGDYAFITEDEFKLITSTSPFKTEVCLN